MSCGGGGGEALIGFVVAIMIGSGGGGGRQGMDRLGRFFSSAEKPGNYVTERCGNSRTRIDASEEICHSSHPTKRTRVVVKRKEERGDRKRDFRLGRQSSSSTKSGCASCGRRTT